MEIISLSNSVVNIKKNKKIICPTCKKEAKKPYKPFCSKKCSDIDLMKWLSNEDHYDNFKKFH